MCVLLHAYAFAFHLHWRARVCVSGLQLEDMNVVGLACVHIGGFTELQLQDRYQSKLTFVLTAPHWQG